MAIAMIDHSDMDDADDFPEHTPAVVQYEFLLRYIAHAAVRVVGFSWFPMIDSDGITFHSVRATDGPDPNGQAHAALMAIGASVEALRLAIRRFGRTAEVRLFPDPARPDVVAHVALGALRTPTLDDRLRFNALTAPITRGAVDEHRPLPQGLLHAVPHLVTHPGVWVSAVAAASDRMRARDCVRQAIPVGGTDSQPGVIDVMRDELVGPLDIAASGLFLLGTQQRTPANTVAHGEALQELVTLLRMHEVRVRVMRLGRAFGEQVADALALPSVPQSMISVAYGAPRL